MRKSLKLLIIRVSGPELVKLELVKSSNDHANQCPKCKFGPHNRFKLLYGNI